MEFAKCSLYEPTGKMGQVDHDNGTATSYTYDPWATRLEWIITVDPTGIPANDLQRKSYSYFKAGDIKAITDELKSITYDYTYDKLHRLLVKRDVVKFLRNSENCETSLSN